MNQHNGSFHSGEYAPRELQGDSKVRKRRLVKRLTPSNITLALGIIFFMLIVFLLIYISR